MGQILDCGASETRKGNPTSKKENIPRSSRQQDSDHHGSHRTKEYQHRTPNNQALGIERIPIDVIDSRNDLWCWAVGYKIQQLQNQDWEIQLETSGDTVVVPTAHVHEPYANLAHTLYFDLIRFNDLLDLNLKELVANTSPTHMFCDVLDIYRDTKHRVAKKWRKAEIVDHNSGGTWIQVHYIGWSHKYNEKINLLRDFQRIRKFGLMTDDVVDVPAASTASTCTETLFKQQLHNNVRGEMRVFLCKGDGNCLFRAVAHQIWADQEQHFKLRTMCCDYMIEHQIGREMFVNQKNFDTYMRKKRKPGVWGDDPEIRAIEMMLDVEIEVWNSELADGGGLEPSTIHLSGSFPPSATADTALTVRISFHGRNHYNSVVMGKCEPPLLPNFGLEGEEGENEQSIRSWRQTKDEKKYIL